MRRIRRDTVRKLYREAILQVFGSGDTELDRHLTNSLKKDVHLAGNGPGDWVGNHGVLEIYCESGIPNASDIHDFSWQVREFGIDPRSAISHNSEQWFKIDKYVNLGLKSLGRHERIHHEPLNCGVVGVYWA
tara:strand:+ start:20854 stop:21249 length:396 start_codon:yes stop_codon:yes gene_type:complete